MSKPTRKAKATAAIVTRRVEELLRIILDGAEFWDICEYVREKEGEEGSAWQLEDGDKPLSDSQIRRYQSKALERISASCRASRKRLLRRHLAQRRNIYAKAINQGDLRVALSALDSEAKLCGLFDEEIGRTIEQLAKEIAELKASYGNSYTPKTPGNDSSGPALPPEPGAIAAGGTAEEGSRAGDDCERPDAGPVASETLKSDMAESITPMFPPGG